jgi:hypothetical protein
VLQIKRNPRKAETLRGEREGNEIGREKEIHVKQYPAHKDLLIFFFVFKEKNLCRFHLSYLKFGRK